MKRNQGISPAVWAITAVGILLTLFLAWTGLRSHPAPTPGKKEESALPPKTIVTDPPPPLPQATSTPEPVNDQGLPPVIPVPLAGIVVAAENGAWINDKDYLSVPHLPQNFGGVRFLMDGLIQLQGQVSKENRNRKYRTAVSVPLSLTNQIGSVHLLGGSRYGQGEDVPLAQMVWHYDDGSTQRTALTNLTHIRDWARNPYEQPAHLSYTSAKVVWVKPQANRTLRLYRVTFANPAPKKLLKSLEFVSEMQDPTLFLVGVTLDPLKPGERPDNSPDLEPTDPIPPRAIQIIVADSMGRPLPNSRLQIEYEVREEKKVTRSSNSLSTDANGVAAVGYPPENLASLDISASHEYFAPRKIRWNLQGGETVPVTYTLKLTGGVNIGATVMDAYSNPIPGAAVSLYRFWSGDDDGPDKRGEQSDFKTQKQTTDANGHWRATGLPSDLMDHIGFEIKHPDFLGTNYNIGGNGSTQQQLRDETFKIVLRRGIGARGLVTDEANNPIPGATVWAGKKYYRERQDTKTDSAGRFVFRQLSEGDVAFGVAAKGYAAEAKTATVEADMADIVFKLKPGHAIRGVVQDESASPIPDVRVVLEGSSGNLSDEVFEFSANTDKEGKFAWDSAPDNPMPFYIGKQGYEQKRNVSLKPDEDNVITLRAPRQLQGLVLDADTGQAVTKFSVRTGRRGGQNDSQVYGVIRYLDYNAPDGRFSVDIDEADDNAVQVWADDYSAKVESFPEAQNGVVELTIQLKPAAGLKGTVTMPDGTPVPGASVVAVAGDASMSAQLQGTHLTSWNQQARVTTTDDKGAFTVGAPPEQGTVVAVADAGFGSAPIDQVRATGILTLQAFGRIEGTLKIAGAPGANQDVLYNPPVSGLSTDFNSYKTTTDEQGHFTMERTPPGEGSIVRLVRTSPNSWTHSYGTSVTVEPGKTTQVTLGDSGGLLQGTVRFQVPPTNGVRITVSGNASSTMPSMPHFNSSDEARVYMNSPEWKAQMKLVKNYAFVVNADGSFQVDSVAPGSYSLNIMARVDGDRSYMNPPIAQGNITATVPDNADPVTPIPVGEVLLKPSMPRQ